MSRVTRPFIAALASGLLVAAPASADVATDMQADLVAAGVPGVSVTVATPLPASATDLAAYRADPSAPAPSVSPDNLISPDPTAPLPLATVRFGTNATTPLPGLIAPPGGTLPFAEAADSAIWRTEIMAALRRALARGATLSGVAMQPLGEAGPDMWLTPPEPDSFPPAALQGTLPVTQVKAEIEQRLPLWARPATVSVVDVLGERRVKLELALRPLDFIANNGQDLVPFLLREQLRLNVLGAGIGAVALRITEAGSGTPLFTYAGDATFGENFNWTSPLVAAWVGRVPDDSGRDLITQTRAQAEEIAQGVANGAPPPPPLP